jgi:Tfp pilus assembly protein PilF
VQARGDRPDARCGLGYALLAAGDAAAAEAQFSEAAALLPGYAEAAQGFQAVAAWRRASYDEAWGLMAETRYEDAAAIFRRLADGEDPRFPAAERSKALASFGFARWRSEDAAAAEAAWNEALKDDPACGLALKGLGMARRKIGDVGGAADRLKTALKLPGFESDYETLVELGLSELSRGAFDDAAAAFQSAIVVAPEFAAAYDGAARVEWKRGKLVEARIYFERSIALDPIAADAADLREAIGVEKEFFKLHGAFGWAWLKLLRNDRAEAAFRAAVKFDPKEPEAPRGLALARLRLGDFKEAAELFGQYFSKAPTKENPWGVLSGAYSEWGWTLYSAGRFGEAEAAFTKLAALHAGEPVAYADPFVGLGWCALGRRQWDRARENFLKAIVISPRDEAASKGLEALKKEQP